jgi:hypothetical protein
MLDPPTPGTRHDPDSGFWHPYTFHPATNWSHAGPIVSNEWYVIEDVLLEWFGPDWCFVKAIMDFPLQWFMRAYVASQFGDQVEDVAGADVARAPNPVNLVQQQLNALRSQRPMQ